MRRQRGPAWRSGRAATRALLAATRVLLAGALALGAVGSCELPKPKIPSLGAAPRMAPTTAGPRTAGPTTAGQGAPAIATALRPSGDGEPAAPQ